MKRWTRCQSWLSAYLPNEILKTCRYMLYTFTSGCAMCFILIGYRHTKYKSTITGYRNRQQIGLNHCYLSFMLCKILSATTTRCFDIMTVKHIWKEIMQIIRLIYISSFSPSKVSSSVVLKSSSYINIQFSIAYRCNFGGDKQLSESYL